MGRQRSTRPTIYDVAREAGVSKSLVSLVLNGSDQVSDAKREAVEKAIRRLGYRPSRVAASLARDRSRTVGLVIDDFQNPWFVDLLAGMRDALTPHGYHVAIREQCLLGERFANAIEGFQDARVDALVVAAEPRRNFGPLGIPVVVEGTRLTDIAGADHVSSDQELGVGLVVQHLWGLGHRRIGHVTGLGGAARHRCEAYVAQIRSRGEEPRVAGVGNETNDEGGYVGTAELLQKFPDVSAVFTANDTMALGARAALREVGREVPRDVALVGYDDSQLARSRFLDLTTVDQRGLDVGKAAAEALLRRLADPEAEPTSTVLPPRLVVRSSTARG